MVPFVERPEEAAAAVEVDRAAESVGLAVGRIVEPLSTGGAVDVI
jgi:hypothetical protein